MSLLESAGDSSTTGNEKQSWEAIQLPDGAVSVAELLSILRRTCAGLKQFLSQEAKFNLVYSNMADVLGFA